MGTASVRGLQPSHRQSQCEVARAEEHHSSRCLGWRRYRVVNERSAKPRFELDAVGDCGTCFGELWRSPRNFGRRLRSHGLAELRLAEDQRTVLPVHASPIKETRKQEAQFEVALIRRDRGTTNTQTTVADRAVLIV